MMSYLKLRCDERFTLRLLHVVAFSKNLRWLAQTKVITLKTQLHAVNARWKRLLQLSLTLLFSTYNSLHWPNLFPKSQKGCLPLSLSVIFKIDKFKLKKFFKFVIWHFYNRFQQLVKLSWMWHLFWVHDCTFGLTFSFCQFLYSVLSKLTSASYCVVPRMKLFHNIKWILFALTCIFTQIACEGKGPFK